jgi:hypothetical protein
MRSVLLSEPLDRITLQSLTTLLDLSEDHLRAVWEQVRRHRAFRTFTMRLPKVREINMPTEPLRQLQERVLTRILYNGPVSPAAYAGVPGRSVRDVAREHLREGASIVALDLRDAYGSTAYRHVSGALRLRLKRELWVLGLSRLEAARVCGALAYFLTVPKGHGPGRKLPLGAPTSVALFNLICIELDSEICQLVAAQPRSHEFHYTRYVDDLVFSSLHEIREDWESQIERIVKKFEYEINPAKTRRMPVANAVICGLERTAQGIEPEVGARARFADQIRKHTARLTGPGGGERSKLRSLAVLRALDSLLRQFYEAANVARPPELQVKIPPVVLTGEAPQIDLLWQ